MQAWSKLVNFPAKFRFCKQPGGTNHNAEGQFATFLGLDEGFFERYFSLLEKQFLLILHVLHNFNICILMTADATPKSSSSRSVLSIL